MRSLQQSLRPTLERKFIELFKSGHTVKDGQVLNLTDLFYKGLRTQTESWHSRFSFHRMKEDQLLAREFYQEIHRVLQKNKVSLEGNGVYDLFVRNWTNKAQLYMSWVQFAAIHATFSYVNHLFTGSWLVVPLYVPKLVVWDLSRVTPIRISAQYGRRLANTAIAMALSVSLVQFLLNPSAMEASMEKVQEGINQNTDLIVEGVRRATDIDQTLRRAEKAVAAAEDPGVVESYLSSFQ